MKQTIVMSLIGLFLGFQAMAQEWPHWRGPHDKFIASERKLNIDAVQNPVKMLWKANVGYGHSTVSILKGRLYTLGETHVISGKDTLIQEQLFCLDAVTGRALWHYGLPALPGRYPGPGSTPWLTEEAVIFQSRAGTVYNVNPNTRQLSWKQDLVAADIAVPTAWGCCSSPVLVGQKILVNAGASGVALNLSDGRILWSGGQAKSGHATPVVFQESGRHLAAFQSDTHFSVVDIDDGTVLAQMPWDSDMDPVKIKGGFYLAGGHKRGLGSMRVDWKEGALSTVWTSSENTHAFQPAIIQDGFAYGIHWKNRRVQPLQCVDLEDGSVRWTQSFGRWGAPLLTETYILMVTGLGELSIAATSPDKYEELGRMTLAAIDEKQLAIDGRPECIWTTPVLNAGLLYVRSTYGDLYCVDLR